MLSSLPSLVSRMTPKSSGVLAAAEVVPAMMISYALASNTASFASSLLPPLKSMIARPTVP